MALPHRFDPDAAKVRRKPALLAKPGDRAGNFTIEQLEMWLQPFPLGTSGKPKGAWQPWKAIAFVVIASTLLWSAILFAVLQFL